MNAKRAKRYRRIARTMAAGRPNRAYVRTTKNKNSVTVSLSPNCTRAEYQLIKHEFLALRREGIL